MEIIQQYIGEIVLGSAGSFLAAGIAGYKALMKRIRALEDTQLILKGKLELNEKLDEMRAK